MNENIENQERREPIRLNNEPVEDLNEFIYLSALVDREGEE